jgi:ribonuclease Z
VPPFGRAMCGVSRHAAAERGIMTKTRFVVMAIALTVAGIPGPSTAEAAPCLVVTLTGTQSGPAVFNGQAGAGTLVRFGDDGNDCGAVKLQFDAGRGTNMRLSQLDVTPVQLNALFFTHMHSDHTEGFADIMQHRWTWNSTGSKLDVVCSADAVSRLGFSMSCGKFVSHIGDAFLQSGEIAQRRAEGGGESRLAGGPAELSNLITFEPKNEPQAVWSLGDVKVSAIRSTHIPGHASYRVDTPAGSVVIGGDATNDVLATPRSHSTSDQVELLAKGADVVVHSTMHPIMGPDRDSGMPPEVFNRQSNTTDLGAMARRVNAKHLMLTHLGPSIGAVSQGAYKVPGGPLTAEDFRKAAEAGGFAGHIIVGTDLTSLRLPAK